MIVKCGDFIVNVDMFCFNNGFDFMVRVVVSVCQYFL